MGMPFLYILGEFNKKESNHHEEALYCSMRHPFLAAVLVVPAFAEPLNTSIISPAVTDINDFIVDTNGPRVRYVSNHKDYMTDAGGPLYYDKDAIVSAVECIASQMAEKTIQHVKKPRVMLIPAPVWEEK